MHKKVIVFIVIILSLYCRLNRLDAALHVCYKERTSLANGLNISRTESIYKTISEMSPELDTIILFSTFINQWKRLRPIFTGEGLCFTFNSLNSRDIYTNE